MKVHDVTIGMKGRVRSFSKIHETTRSFFREVIPSIPLSEKLIPKTPFHLAVKDLGISIVFELYHAEQLCFATYCCLDPTKKEEIMSALTDMAQKMGFPSAVEPSTDIFLYTFPANPMLPPQLSMLAGEIGFYIFFRLYEIDSNKS